MLVVQHLVVLVVAYGSVLVSGELSSTQKQILLDLNNIYRASQVKTATRILVRISMLCREVSYLTN